MDRLAALLNSYKPRTITVVAHPIVAGEQRAISAQQASAKLCLLQRGSAVWQSADNTEITLKAGDLLWVTNHTGQWHATAEDAVIVVCELQFGPENQNPLMERLPDCVAIYADSYDAASALAPVIDMMLQETMQAECGQSEVQHRLAEVLMIRVLRFLMRHSILSVGVIGALGDARLARAMTAMHEQPGEDWTVDNLARHAGMSRTAFSNSFKAVVGKTPMRYLTDWRMGLASKWLADRRQSVAAVGERLGYRSETAFRRAFRNTMGEPPGHARDRL